MTFGFSFWNECIHLDEGMMTKPVVTSLERWDGAGDIIPDVSADEGLVVVWLGNYQTLQHTSAVSLNVNQPTQQIFIDILRITEIYPLDSSSVHIH
jgi:hypothetical protein